MEVRDRLTVQEWHKAAPPRRDSPRVATMTSKSSVLGVLGTLVFHIILVASLGVSFGGGLSAPRRLIQNPAAGLGASESLLLLPDGAISRSAELKMDLRPPSNALDNAPLLLKPPPIVNTERLALEDLPALAGSAELALAAEIYDRQIHARIDRIWQRPNTNVAPSSTAAAASNVDAAFRCQAQLEQDDRGNVLEVLLPVCNGSSEWRDSLLTAIRQASPLPAPPDPRVFSTSLVLHFEVQVSSTVAPKISTSDSPTSD